MNYINNYSVGLISPDDFIYEITVPANTQVYLDFEVGYTYNCVIIYGDGTESGLITSYDDPQIIHTYVAAGTYQVMLRGTCEFFKGYNVKNYLTKIVQWGNVGLKYLNLQYANKLTTLSTSPTMGLSKLEFITCDGCTKLTSIPTNLLLYTSQITSFEYCFRNCVLLKSIPTDLFRYNTNISSTGFRGTFKNCQNITSIPEDIFRYGTGATNFEETFYSCYKLTNLSSNLFKYNTLASRFYRTFYQNLALTTLPADLFKYNPEGVFTDTFYECSNLETLPNYLFRYIINSNYGNFISTFIGCYKLQMNPWIFYADGEQSTRFLGHTYSFLSFMERSAFNGTQGTAPDLWNCTFDSVGSTRCFAGDGNNILSLSNYLSIPIGWK